MREFDDAYFRLLQLALVEFLFNSIEIIEEGSPNDGKNGITT
jgi:hypothetical protein